MIKAIETLYKGYRFRSRIEAKWAVFFDALSGVKWEYEKEGYILEDGTCYLPDFWIPVLHDYDGEGCFVEIKGVEPTDEERNKLELLAKGTGHKVLCFWGEIKKDWSCTVYNKNGLYIYDGNFDIENMWFLNKITSKQNYHIIDFIPFGYLFSIYGDKTKRSFIEAGIKKARAARFEHGETS